MYLYEPTYNILYFPSEFKKGGASPFVGYFKCFCSNLTLTLILSKGKLNFVFSENIFN